MRKFSSHLSWLPIWLSVIVHVLIRNIVVRIFFEVNGKSFSRHSIQSNDIDSVYVFTYIDSKVRRFLPSDPIAFSRVDIVDVIDQVTKLTATTCRKTQNRRTPRFETISIDSGFPVDEVEVCVPELRVGGFRPDHHLCYCVAQCLRKKISSEADVSAIIDIYVLNYTAVEVVKDRYPNLSGGEFQRIYECCRQRWRYQFERCRPALIQMAKEWGWKIPDASKGFHG